MVLVAGGLTLRLEILLGLIAALLWWTIAEQRLRHIYLTVFGG